MRLLKHFEEFLHEGIAKKVSVDRERAKSLVKESERRMLSLKIREEKLGYHSLYANDYVEYCYDLLLHLIHAQMYIDGYSSSGLGAHEAEVSYLRKLGFVENDVLFLNQVRYFRNGILYYGSVLDVDYAEKVVEFTKRIYPQLKAVVDRNLL